MPGGVLGKTTDREVTLPRLNPAGRKVQLLDGSPGGPALDEGHPLPLEPPPSITEEFLPTLKCQGHPGMVLLMSGSPGLSYAGRYFKKRI